MQKCECLIMSKLQSSYIDTRVPQNYITKIGTDIQPFSDVIFGARGQSNSNYFIELYVDGSTLKFRVKNITIAHETSIVQDSRGIFEIDVVNKKIKSYGNSYNISTTFLSDSGNNSTMYIGALHNNNGTAFSHGSCRFYSLYIDYSNGTQIYHISMQPCYVKTGKTFKDIKGNTCPAGTIGMYDIINNDFYTNDGDGTFTKGNDI